MNNVTILEEDFEEYEKLRSSGVVNMLDVTRVMSLTNLSRQQIEEIIAHYEDYSEEFEVDV